MTLIVFSFIAVKKIGGTEMILFFGILFCFFTNSFFWFLICFEFILIPIGLFIWTGKTGERFSRILFILRWTLLFSTPVLMWIFLERIIGRIFEIGGEVIIRRWFLVLCFIFIFAVKFPVFLLHVWLPRAHVEAPTYGRIILAACLLKLGTYGLFRFLEIRGESFFFLLIGSWGAVLASWVRLIQEDIKAFIAYSRVVHISVLFIVFSSQNHLLTLRILTVRVRHGFVSCFLFLWAGERYEICGTRSLAILRGIVSCSTFLSSVFLVFSFINCGLPFSLNFFREIAVLIQILSFSWAFSFLLLIVRFICGVFSFLFFNFSQEKIKTKPLSESGLFLLMWRFFFLI